MGKTAETFSLWQVDILLKCSMCYITMHIIGFKMFSVLYQNACNRL